MELKEKVNISSTDNGKLASLLFYLFEKQNWDLVETTPQCWEKFIKSLNLYIFMIKSLISPSKRDYTTGSIVGAIWALAIPMILEMMFMSLYQIADLFWVGKLGTDALAAVAIGGMIRWTIVSLSNGIAIGGLAIVARRIGDKRYEDANHTTTQAILLSLFTSLFFILVGFLTMKPLLHLLGAKGRVFFLGKSFLTIVFLGIGSIVSVFVINSLFRGAGDAHIALLIIAITSLSNVILEPFLALGWGPFPRLGVQGAALSTVITQSLGLLIQFFILTTGRSRIRLLTRGGHLIPDFILIKEMVAIGFPSAVQMFLRATSRMVLMGLVGLFGTPALAGYGVANRILLGLLIPCFGMGNAAATLVGQNLGAGKPKRAERSAWTIGGYNLLYISVSVLLLFIFAKRLIFLFDGDSSVVTYGAKALRIMGPSYIFTALGVVMARGLNGAGDTVPPMSINLLTLWLLQIPLAYLLSRTPLSSDGLWLGIALANVINGVLMTLWFSRGRWKFKEV